MAWAEPSATLKSAMQGWIADYPHPAKLGQWPTDLGRQRQMLLLDGNQAYLWYLDLKGQVWVVDTDRFGHPLELETDREAARAALQSAAREHPQLSELLEP
jgi:hypothetical protein